MRLIGHGLIGWNHLLELAGRCRGAAWMDLDGFHVESSLPSSRPDGLLQTWTWADDHWLRGRTVDKRIMVGELRLSGADGDPVKVEEHEVEHWREDERRLSHKGREAVKASGTNHAILRIVRGPVPLTFVELDPSR